MTFWEYLDRRGERNARRESRILPHDFRGWVALGLFLQSTALFAVMAAFPSLLDNQAYTTLATAIIVTGWIGGVAAFAYSAGKQQGEASALAKQAMDLAGGQMGGADPVTHDEAAGARKTANAADRQANIIEAQAQQHDGGGELAEEVEEGKTP